MKKSTIQRGAGESVQQGSAFQLKPVAAACAVLMLSMGGTAYAQQVAPAADSGVVQTVSVTGIRRGIEDAISVKKNSDSIVETISAEDIGKLPDSSIAESIARLPGLAAQRVAGRSSTIDVRGLSGDFTNTLLNGREQASVGDNRAVEYDQYPAELISAVTVYKTPDAQLIGQGLAGTINLQTVRPLDFGKRVIQMNARAEHNSLGTLNPEVSSNGNRFSASYIDQFANRTFGVAIGYAHLDSPGESQKWSSWGWGNANGLPGVIANQGSELWASSTKNVRDGLMGVFEWKPSKDFTSTIDTYYSRFTASETRRAFQAGTGSWMGGLSYTNPVVNNGVLVGGTVNGITPVLRNDFNDASDSIFAIGWNNKLKSDKWTLVGDVSMSRARAQQTLLETYSGAFSKDSAGFNVSNSGVTFNNAINYADPAVIKLGDPGGWGQDGYIKYPKTTDELKSLRLSAKREMDGMFSSVDFGFNFASREKTRVAPEFFENLTAGRTTTQAIPSNLLVSPVSLGFGGIPATMSYNIPAVLSQFYTATPNIHQDIFAKDWTVDEKVATAYAQLNIDSEVGKIPVRGNVGLQFVHTNQSSDALSDNPAEVANPVTTSGGTTYHNVLPSLNLAFTLPNDQTLRVGAARELARARLDQMKASRTASLNTATLLWSGSGGNPELKPWIADAFDVSYEKYFGAKGYVAVTPFYKNLKTYIYQQNSFADFSGVPTNGLVPASNIGVMSLPANGTGGIMKGIEFSVSVPLNMVAQALDGFGVVANAMHGDTNIQPNGPGTTGPLPGFSKNVTNLTFYYEKYGFSARISQNYRSSYLGEIQGFGADRAYQQILGSHTTDFQTSYEFSSGSLKGATLLFQVSNMTNEPYRAVFTDGNPKEFTTYGRSFLLGVNYKM